MKQVLYLFAAFVLACSLNAQQLDFDALNQTAKDHLINLIEIDTSQPEPEEIKAIRYIYKVLNKYKIDWDIYRIEKPRGNLIAVLKADKELADPQNKPLLLIAHLDTAAIQEGWTLPPAKATLKDGRIYGLGSTDAKNYAAINLTVLTRLAKGDIKLKRDIIFLFTADEESGSEKGIKYLYDQHGDKLQAAYALNEGGGIMKGDDAKMPSDILFIEAGTKMYMDILLSAKGDGGNSSAVGQNNAIYKLSQALSIIESYQPLYKFSPLTKIFFERIFPFQDADAQTTLKLLESDDPAQSQQAAKIISEDEFFKTQITDTITPTILSSGTEANTVQNEASANLNCRLLPQSDPMLFVDELSALFANDENVTLTVIERPETPFPQPPTDLNDQLFKAIEKAARQTFGKILVLPGLTPASSESEFLRRHGVITYGIGPLIQKNGNGPHEPDESITEKDLFDQLKLTFNIVMNLVTDTPDLPEEEPSVAQEGETQSQEGQTPQDEFLPVIEREDITQTAK